MGKHDPEVPGSHRFLLFVPRWCENLIDRPSLKYPQVSAIACAFWRGDIRCR